MRGVLVGLEEGYYEREVAAVQRRRARLARRAFVLGGVAALAGAGWWGVSVAGGRSGPGPKAVPRPPQRPVAAVSGAGAPDPVWTHTADWPLTDPVTAAGDGRVYVLEAGLTALDAATGAVRWRAGEAGESLALAAGAGVVFATGTSGVLAYPAGTGKRRWIVSATPKGDVFYPGERVLAADERAVYVLRSAASRATLQQMGQEVVALSCGTGARLWSRPVANGGAPLSVALRALAVDGRLLLLDGQSTLAVLDAGDGRAIWTAPAGCDLFDPLAAGAGAVYCRAGTDGLQALESADGRQRWLVKAPVGGSDDYPFRPLVAAGDAVYGGSGSTAVHAWSAADGREVWRCVLPFEPSGVVTPLVRAGSLFVAGIGDRQGVAAVDLATGRLRWTFQVDPATVPQYAQWQLSADDDRLFVAIGPTVFALPVR